MIVPLQNNSCQFIFNKPKRKSLSTVARTHKGNLTQKNIIRSIHARVVTCIRMPAELCLWTDFDWT